MNVYLNFGRWVVHCPSLDCMAAEEVIPDMARTWCRCQPGTFCQHGNPCGTRIELEWPSDLEAIERVTAPRHVRNRNWLPGETLDDLKRENLMHGVGI